MRRVFFEPFEVLGISRHSYVVLLEEEHQWSKQLPHFVPSSEGSKYPAVDWWFPLYHVRFSWNCLMEWQLGKVSTSLLHFEGISSKTHLCYYWSENGVVPLIAFLDLLICMLSQMPDSNE